MDLPDWTTSVVFSSDLLVEASAGAGDQLAAGASVDLSLAQYSSLIVIARSIANVNLQLDFHALPAIGGVWNGAPFTEFLSSIDSPLEIPTWVIPITAGTVHITNIGTAGVDLLVYGSNRPVTIAQVLGASFQPRQFSFVGAVTSGTLVVPPPFDAGPAGTNFNGPLWVRASSTVVAGLFGYEYLDQANVLRRIYVGNLVVGHTFTQCAQPVGIVKWIVLPSATSATSNIALDITPMN